MSLDRGGIAPAETIGDLRRNGRRLGLTCTGCSRFRYMKDARFPDTVTVTAIALALRCARCGSPDVLTAAVARCSTTGHWPAERS
ncbi:hypothetical protein [Polymorphum gilvum]|uniref:Uncharacterized protein n=1 Tax=Polymorphum gilvum (strain LMG 25793 / CGMCC 1.9160 / SL003B-26A1) TaxID=991905 RepID=F2J493_POLGS|nr:hypothetical protein [Polymorphum gilvum]ADZ71035.1 hypothetical protein SL003B_2612 [Polymorphum gilvum SL003B-26A1]